MSGALAVEEAVELPITEPVSAGVIGSTYKFDEFFQAKIAALALRDASFMQRTDGLIRPEYFENVVDAALVNIAIRYYEKYKKVPGDRVTIGHLIRHDVIAKIIRSDDARAVASRLKERPAEDIDKGMLPGLFQMDISDRDYVIDQVSTFARHQAVSKAILDSVEHLDINDFDKISASLKKALDVGQNSDGGDYAYGDMIDSRTEERLERAAGKLPPTGVSTGSPEIDRVLYHKGWGRRELSVLMGGAKAGKTTAMIDFGISACGHLHRYNVLYVTLEVSAKIIAERLDANIAETLVFELGTHIHDVKDKVKRFMSKAGRFDIKEFPTGTMRVSDLRRHLERQKAKGVMYDLVIVDYADLMAPERMTDNSIENSKSVYVNLRGLAMQEDIAILTATQTNRDGAKKMVATMTDVAEDFNKVRIADIIISINKTDDERDNNQARLYFAACRNQRSGFSIRIEQDIDRMKFVKAVLGEE